MKMQMKIENDGPSFHSTDTTRREDTTRQPATETNQQQTLKHQNSRQPPSQTPIYKKIANSRSTAQAADVSQAVSGSQSKNIKI